MEEKTMERHDFNDHDEQIADICNYEEANPWHCHEASSNLDYEYRANGWVHVPDEPATEDGPHCPIDALDALEFCGRLAYMIANGETVSPEEAARAAGQAVKCFAFYDYEQQPWFTEAWLFTKKREPSNIQADERPAEPHVDAGSSNKCNRDATT